MPKQKHYPKINAHFCAQNIKAKLMNNRPIILAGRLKREKYHNLLGLIDSLYTPEELANDVGFTRRQVYRVYIPLGCPHQRNERDHILINGKLFREWYFETYKKPEIASDEVYCLSCKQIVPIVNSVSKSKGRYKYQLITCPNCGKKVSKAITNRKEL